MALKKNDGNSSQHSLRNMGVASNKEARFVFAVGLLLSFNSGYINGLCLSGLLTQDGSLQEAVSSVTGTYTDAALSLAEGDIGMFVMDMGVIFCFILGSTVSGFMNPQAVPHKLVPSNGPTFLIGSLCMFAFSFAAAFHPGTRALYNLAAAANGIQNGMSSSYTANLIRTSHHTGTSTDIGLIIGQMLRGNWKNYWKFKVLTGLAISFWVGSVISLNSASEFQSLSLCFSAALYLLIGLTHVTFVTLTQHVSFVQAAFGTWQWDKVLGQIAQGLHEGTSKTTSITAMTDEQIDQVFDSMDVDKTGEIQARGLIVALEKLGMKVTGDVCESMIAVADMNGDGSVDRDDFHTLLKLAATRVRKKMERTPSALSLFNVERRPSDLFKMERRSSQVFRRKSEATAETDPIESAVEKYRSESITVSEGSTNSTEEKEQDQSELTLHQLPLTYQDVLRMKLTTMIKSTRHGGI